MTRKVAAGVLAAMATLMPLAGCAGSASDKAGGKSGHALAVLTLAFAGGDPNSDANEQLQGFIGWVRRLSGGEIRIDDESAWRSGQIHSETGLINDVRAGKADLGVVGSPAWDSVGVSSLRALSAPLLIGSYALQERVLRRPMIAQMLGGLRPLGLVGIGVLPGPLRRPFGIARALLKPSDYAGLRIGVQQSRIGDATMRVLRAAPVGFAFEAPIAGLGGIEQHISDIEDHGYGEVGKYLTANVVLWPRPLVVFANRRALARLTPAQRHVLRQAALDDIAAETRHLRAADRTAAAILCREHVRFLTATSADVAALRHAVQPVYTRLERDAEIRRFIAQIKRLGAGVGAEPAASCAGTATPLAASAGPVDGVWEMNTRYGDDPSDPAPVPENYGRWIFVFDRGRFADTQHYLNACTWGYGTFTVKANEMAWTFADGGGVEPTGSANKPGEFFRFRWSLYRDTMTVAPVRGAVSPSNFRLKPWRRLSIVPSARYLSKRCPPPANALPP